MGFPDASKPPPCEEQHNCPVVPLPSAPPPPYPPPPPPPAASHGREPFVTALIIAGSVLGFLAICLSIFIFVRRRRQRRLREALLEAALAPAAPGAFPDDVDEGGGPGGEVVHHAWHIRTVGLDEAAIESIALTRFRAGGALGASDCTVCLGEFQDGELLRLLPKCAHAFHVQCIDTWLRAHVSCPLCRADVMDPAAAAAEQPDPPPGAGADASAQQFASNRAMEHERPDQHANEQQDPRVQSDQSNHSSSPERPHRHPGARAHNFRRVASMDSPFPTASAEDAPEQEQADGEKQGTGGAVCCEVSPGSGHPNRLAMERSLSAGSRWRWTSRHCRARSSLLPL